MFMRSRLPNPRCGILMLNYTDMTDQEIGIIQRRSMNDDLLALFPEFNAIDDLSLKEKVIAVWREALEIGRCTLEDLVQMPYTLLVKDVVITFPEHVRVVCHMCLTVEDVLKEFYGSRYAIYHDTLVAGALLADVGKLLKNKIGESMYVWAEMFQYL